GEPSGRDLRAVRVIDRATRREAESRCRAHEHGGQRAAARESDESFHCHSLLVAFRPESTTTRLPVARTSRGAPAMRVIGRLREGRGRCGTLSRRARGRASTLCYGLGALGAFVITWIPDTATCSGCRVGAAICYRTKSMYPRSTSTPTSFTVTRSPTSSPS